MATDYTLPYTLPYKVTLLNINLKKEKQPTAHNSHQPDRITLPLHCTMIVQLLYLFSWSSLKFRCVRNGATGFHLEFQHSKHVPWEKILPNSFEVDSLQIASRSGLHLRRALRFSFGSEDVLDDGGVQTVAHLLCASLQMLN